MSDLRQLSTGELLDAARRMHRRIGKVLDAIDEGDDDAIDELAAALRTTLCYGKGDKLLLRLCNTFSVQPTEVQIPCSRTVRREQMIARVGPIPSEQDTITEEAPDTLSVFKWIQSPAVLLPGVGGQTWEKVIVAYANTYGSHVSSTVPRLLDDIKVFQGPKGHMGGYLLRVAGAIAEYHLGTALARIDGVEEPISRRMHPPDVSIVIMTITDQWPIEFGFSCSATESIEILSMPMGDGTTFHAVWHWDSLAETGSLSTSVE